MQRGPLVPGGVVDELLRWPSGHADLDHVNEGTSTLQAELAPWGAVRGSAVRLVPTGAVLFATLMLDRPMSDPVPMPAGGTGGPGGRPRPGRPVRTALVHGADWLLGR